MYRLQPNERLCSPEYWGDYDITDPEQFSPYQPPLGFELTRRNAAKAITSLEACLASVHDGTHTQIRNLEGQHFGADAHTLPAGTVLLIEEDRLQVYRPSDEPFIPPINQPAVPLSKPFANHWREQQGRTVKEADPHFGGEDMLLADGRWYGHSVDWGVVCEQDGQRGVVSWPLHTIRANTNISNDPRFRFAVALPFEIGTVEAWRGGEDGLATHLSRIMDIWEVRPGTEDNGDKHGLLDRAKRLIAAVRGTGSTLL